MDTFVGRGSELTSITNNAIGGRSSYVAAGRRFGKTMLLRKAAKTLRAMDIATTYVDMQAMERANGTAALIAHIAGEVGQQLGATVRGGTVLEIAEAVVSAGSKWCLLIDEVELLALMDHGPVLLDNLRHTVSNSEYVGDVSVVVAGGPDLALSLRAQGSPLLNVCTPVALRPLFVSDLQPLVELGVPLEHRDAVRAFLWQEAGGHPFLAQALLEALPETMPPDLTAALESTRSALVGRVRARLGTTDQLIVAEARRRLNEDVAASSIDDDLVAAGLFRQSDTGLEVNGTIIAEALAGIGDQPHAAGHQVNADWLPPLLEAGETQTIEFKETIKWDVREGRERDELKYELVGAVAGFMNAEGGTLLVGVNADGGIVGLHRDIALLHRAASLDGLCAMASNLLRSALGGAAGAIQFRSAGPIDAPVLVLSVAPSPDPVIARFHNKDHFYD